MAEDGQRGTNAADSAPGVDDGRARGPEPAIPYEGPATPIVPAAPEAPQSDEAQRP